MERGYELTVDDIVPMREFYSRGFFYQGRKVHPLYLTGGADRPEYKEYVSVQEVPTATGFWVAYSDPAVEIYFGKFDRQGVPKNQEAEEILRLLGLSTQPASQA